LGAVFGEKAGNREELRVELFWGPRMEILIKIGLAICGGIVLLELRGLNQHLARLIVHRAARRLPADHCDRFVEENLADIEAIDGPISKLFNAFGVYWAGIRQGKVLAQISPDKKTRTDPAKQKIGKDHEGLASFRAYFHTRNLTRIISGTKIELDHKIISADPDKVIIEFKTLEVPESNKEKKT
jgi:hypothetical protein